MGEKQNKYVRSSCTAVVPVLIVRKRNDSNELWHTIPYHLQPNYTRNKSMVCTGIPEEKEKEKENHEGQERRIRRKEGKEKKESEANRR